MPGLASSSARTSLPESVTARLTFLRIDAGSSSTSMMPCGEDVDLPIFAFGLSRSVIFATSARMYGRGTAKVGPNRWLNRCARSLVSSRCWRWSSPTGTWSVW